MNIPAIKIIVSELNNLQAIANPENLFEINFDLNGDLIIDWRNRKSRSLMKYLAKELGLDYRKDFKLGHTRVENLPEKINSREKLDHYLNETIEEYIEVAEIFIK
jgi:hypothetical protein